MSPARLVLPLAFLRFNLKAFIHKIGLAYDILDRRNTIYRFVVRRLRITAVHPTDYRHHNGKHVYIHVYVHKCMSPDHLFLDLVEECMLPLSTKAPFIKLSCING